MHVTVLGSGAALPDPCRSHPGYVVTVQGRHHLLDCGHGATLQMMRANIDPTEVNHVFLSHLHFDHTYDFGFFLLSSWMLDREQPPIVYGPEGTQAFIDHLFEGGAFDVDIRARAEYAKRAANRHVLKPDVRVTKPGPVYEDNLIRVSAAYAAHIPRHVTECFGYRLEAEGKSVVFSGDSAPCDTLFELCKGADVLMHDCTFPKEALEYRNKSKVGTTAHTSPRDLGRIAKDAGVKTLIASHFGHFDTTNPILRKKLSIHMPMELAGPEWLESVVSDIRENFDGDLRLASDLMRVNL